MCTLYTSYFCSVCFSFYFQRCPMWLQWPQYNHLANICCPYLTNKLDVSDSFSFINVVYIYISQIFNEEKNVHYINVSCLVKEIFPIQIILDPSQSLKTSHSCAFCPSLCCTFHITTHNSHIFFFLKSSWRYTLSSWPHCSALQMCQTIAPSPSAELHCVVLRPPGPFRTQQSLPGQPGTSAAAAWGLFSAERPLPAAPHFFVLGWWYTHEGEGRKTGTSKWVGVYVTLRIRLFYQWQEWEERSVVCWLVNLYHVHWLVLAALILDDIVGKGRLGALHGWVQLYN